MTAAGPRRACQETAGRLCKASARISVMGPNTMGTQLHRFHGEGRADKTLLIPRIGLFWGGGGGEGGSCAKSDAFSAEHGTRNPKR